MSLDALALKYRPKKLSDVVGQDVVVQIIANSFQLKDLHHAYILSGKMGCGKTSVARIFAAMENCVNGPTLEPCGTCSNCEKIFAGKSTDVKEIDAASNRGIDDVRSLKEEINYVPIECRTKYIILDEAHAQTSDAAKAALKMVEEPPPRVRFLFCTTSPESLLETIRGRCINLNFNKIHWTKLHTNLTKISQLEQAQISDDALKLIAKRSQGSARNSLQSLQAVLTFAGSKPATIEMVQKSLGTVDDTFYYRFVQNIVDLDIVSSMKTLNSMISVAPNAYSLIDGISEHLRNLLLVGVCKNNPTALGDMGYADDDIKKLAFQSEKAKPVVVSNMLGMMVGVQDAIIKNLDPETYLGKFALDTIIQIVKENNSKARSSNDQGPQEKKKA